MRRLAAAVALVAAALALAWAFLQGAAGSGIDFYCVWATARRVAEGGALDVYSAAGQREMGRRSAVEAAAPDAPTRLRVASATVLGANGGAMPVAGTPFLFAALRPFSRGGYEADYAAYLLASLVALAASFGALARLAGWGWTGSLVAVALGLVLLEPAVSELRVANVNPFLLAAAVLAALLERAGNEAPRSAVQGFVLALAACFKPLLVPALLLFPLGWRASGRGRRLVAFSGGALAAAAVALGASAALFGGLAPWGAWLRTLGALARPPYPVALGNVGLSSLLREALGADLALPLLLGAGVLAVRAARGAGGERGPGEATAAGDSLTAATRLGAGTAVLLLSARLVWIHYYLLVIPLAAFALRRGREAPGEKGDRWLGVAALAGLSRLSPLLGTEGLAWCLSGATATLLVVAGRRDRRRGDARGGEPSPPPGPGAPGG